MDDLFEKFGCGKDIKEILWKITKNDKYVSPQGFTARNICFCAFPTLH